MLGRGRGPGREGRAPTGAAACRAASSARRPAGRRSAGEAFPALPLEIEGAGAAPAVRTHVADPPVRRSLFLSSAAARAGQAGTFPLRPALGGGGRRQL